MRGFAAGLILRFFGKDAPDISDKDAHLASHTSNTRKLGVMIDRKTRSRLRRRWLRLSK